MRRLIFFLYRRFGSNTQAAARILLVTSGQFHSKRVHTRTYKHTQTEDVLPLSSVIFSTSHSTWYLLGHRDIATNGPLPHATASGDLFMSGKHDSEITPQPISTVVPWSPPLSQSSTPGPLLDDHEISCEEMSIICRHDLFFLCDQRSALIRTS